MEEPGRLQSTCHKESDTTEQLIHTNTQALEVGMESRLPVAL